MSFRLDGKTALITGAAGGIGSAISHAMHAAGADLVLVDLPEKQDALAATAPAGAAVLGVDVIDESAVETLFSELDSQGMAIDILVNNAGIARPETIFETALDSWNEVLAVNLTGAFLFARAAITRMQPRRAGRIIQMGSVVGHQGALKGHLHYGVSKSGMHGFTHTLARTAAPFGVTVNAIAPGLVETDMLLKTHGEAGIAELAKQVPLGRLASVEDVAAAAVYLASDAASYLTGVVLDVNGGLYMR